MSAPHILMIEDDERLARMVGGLLGQNGFTIEHVIDAKLGFESLLRRQPDLVLLDLMLPDADGLDVCRELRSRHPRMRDVPVIMVTARGDLHQRLIGLEIGADDYLAKPFEPLELLARVRAVLRRTRADRGRPQRDVMLFGRMEIDRGAREIRIDQELRSLTSLQFDLLVLLAQNAGRVLSREQLRQGTRGESIEAFDRSIDVHIGKIRSVIEDDPHVPRRLLTVRSIGYVFSRTADEQQQRRS